MGGHGVETVYAQVPGSPTIASTMLELESDVTTVRGGPGYLFICTGATGRVQASKNYKTFKQPSQMKNKGRHKRAGGIDKL